MASRAVGGLQLGPGSCWLLALLLSGTAALSLPPSRPCPSLPAAAPSLPPSRPCPSLRAVLSCTRDWLCQGICVSHKGTLEGFKVETADLKETLAGKEDSEHRLVLELESLRRQLQQAAQEQAALREECTRLWSRGEATATDAEAREAGKECGIWRSVQAVGRGYSCHGFPSSQGRSVSLEGQV